VLPPGSILAAASSQLLAGDLLAGVLLHLWVLSTGGEPKRELRYFVLGEGQQANPALALLERSVLGAAVPGRAGRRYKIPPPPVCNSILSRAVSVSLQFQLPPLAKEGGRQLPPSLRPVTRVGNAVCASCLPAARRMRDWPAAPPTSPQLCWRGMCRWMRTLSRRVVGLV
jgi:hypothetical protein